MKRAMSNAPTHSRLIIGEFHVANEITNYKHMKTKLTILMLVLMSMSMSLIAQEKPKKEMTSLYLTTEMDCQSCEQKITEQLKYEKGVRDLKCDYKKQTIYVLYKAGSNSTENIMKSLAKIGYTAKEITKEAYDLKQQ